MKKIIFFLAAAISLQAFPTYVEIKGGYSRFTDHTIREIFDSWNGSVQGEAGAFVFRRLLAVFANVAYTGPSGHALGGGHETTHLHLTTAAVGPKAFYFPVRYFGLYAGVGPRYFFYHEHNDSNFVKRDVHRYGLGGAFMGGFIVGFKRHRPFLDLFVDYSVKRFHKQRNNTSSQVFNVKLDNLVAGAGLGYLF